MKKITLPKMMRAIAVLIFIIGAGLGYDAGNKMITVNQQITYVFDLWLALLVWLAAFALGILFLAIARILDLLD